MTQLKFWSPEQYLWNSLSSNHQILHRGRMYQILAYRWQTTPKRGMVRVTRPVFYLDARNHISGTTEARVAKFCVHNLTFCCRYFIVDCIQWLWFVTCFNKPMIDWGRKYQMLALGWQTSSHWAWSGHVTVFFLILPPVISLESV